MPATTDGEIICGDCLDVMRGMDADSFDSIITDPPYALTSKGSSKGGFMGKAWDATLPDVDVWREALRVAKPGAHLLAFGGTRTFHRLACAIEDAGWEIRDCIMWVHAQGFPKSANVSKMIDKAAGAEREVIGWTDPSDPMQSSGGGQSSTVLGGGISRGHEPLPITAPATDAARQWQGWGTSLKPALEPVIVATKPLPVATMFDNILIEVALLLLSEDVLCRKLNVPVNGVELLFRSTLPLFVKAAASSALGSARISVLASRELARLADVCSTLNDPELSAASRRIAAESAATRQEAALVMPTAIGVAESSLVEMGAFSSGLGTNTGWSIALLWRNILADLCIRQRTFTTETMTHLITDLKILKSLAMPNISQRDIPSSETRTNGEQFDATAVDAILKSVSVKSSSLDQITALENASTDIGRKPNFEPVIVARKPLIGTVAQNVQRFGTGALNIDGCRIATDWATDPNKHGWQGTAISDDGVVGFSGISGIKNPHNAGRFPANLIHDGSDEVLRLFPSSKSPKSYVRSSSTTNVSCYGKGIGDKGTGFLSENYGDDGSAARFFYCPKASKRDRDEGLDERNGHPCVKPTDLMRYLCRLVTPPNGLVLDPFCGSGSTGKAARLEGFRFVGIEQDANSVDIARRRVAHAAG